MDSPAPAPQPASRVEPARLLKPASRSVDAVEADEWLLFDDLEDHSDPGPAVQPVRQGPAPTERQRAALAKDASTHTQMQLEATLGQDATWRTVVRDDLFKYGYGVLPSKVSSGEIFRMMHRVRAPRAGDLALPTTGPAMTAEEAQDLATDAVLWAIERFHKVLLEEWSPDFEATFRTYFIGKCCHGFVGVYRKWLRDRRRRGYVDLDHLAEDQIPVARDKPHVAAIIRLEFEQVLEATDDDLELSIAVAKALEVPSNVIASILDVSDKVVEYRLKKLRGRAA